MLNIVYEDYIAITTAMNILKAFNGSYKPHLLTEKEISLYSIRINDDGYVLLKSKEDGSEPDIVTVNNKLEDFIENTLKAWTGTEYKAEEVFSSDAVQIYLKKQLAPCTFYWNFMLDIYKTYEESGFDNTKTREYITNLVKALRPFSPNYGTWLSEKLLIYTIEHFIRFTHEPKGLNGDTKYLATLDPIIDYIFEHNVQDFVDMTTSYPDMGEIKQEYVAEALSDLKSFASELVTLRPSVISNDAHAHLLMRKEIGDFASVVLPTFAKYNHIVCHSSYAEKNRQYSLKYFDIFPGKNAHDEFCKFIDELIANSSLTYKDIRYSVPPRWRWNEDKTKILDIGSRAAFEPSFFGPDSKEWKEADEAETGLVLRELPEDYRTCNFSQNATILTEFCFGYPNLISGGNMARIVLEQTYHARDGFCTRCAHVHTYDYRERLDEKRVCWITKEILENALKVSTCNREPFPEKPYDSGWMFFGERQDDDYINNPDNIVMADLRTFLDICPDANTLMDEYNKIIKSESYSEEIIDENDNKIIHTHEEVTMSFPMETTESEDNK